MSITNKEIVNCDYCDAGGMKIDDYDKLLEWTYGKQGEIFPMTSVSGCFRSTIKHSCPKSLCQAKLLVWTRS